MLEKIVSEREGGRERIGGRMATGKEVGWMTKQVSPLSLSPSLSLSSIRGGKREGAIFANSIVANSPLQIQIAPTVIDTEKRGKGLTIVWGG